MVFAALIFLSVPSSSAPMTGPARSTAPSSTVSNRIMYASSSRLRVGRRGHRSTFARGDATARGGHPSFLDRDARRRLAHVDVRARRRAGNHAPRRDEGDSRFAQVLHEGAALRAIRMHGHVEGVPVIEAHTVVEGGLTVSAHGQRASETGREELLEPGRTGLQRPRAGAVVADQGRGLLVPASPQGRQRRHRAGRGRLDHGMLRLGDGPASLLELLLGGGHRRLGGLELLAGDDAAAEELPPLLALLDGPRELLFVDGEEHLQLRAVVRERRDHLGDAGARRGRRSVGGGRGRGEKGGAKGGGEDRRRASPHRGRGGWARTVASSISVPQPGPVGTVRWPSSMSGFTVTRSSCHCTTSGSVSMMRRFGTTAQKCALIIVASGPSKLWEATFISYASAILAIFTD